MIKINLAPPRQRKPLSLALPALNLGIVFGILYVVGLAAVGGYWWMLSSEEDQLNNDIAIATKQLQTLKTAIAEGNAFKRQRDELEKRVRAVEELTRAQPRPIYLLEAVLDTVPRNLWITSATERERLLRLSGAAFSTTAVADFMSNLKASGKFKDVDLVVSRQDLAQTPRVVTFEVVCRFEI
jgi:type IV pilus assembly protein PilN